MIGVLGEIWNFQSCYIFFNKVDKRSFFNGILVFVKKVLISVVFEGRCIAFKYRSIIWSESPSNTLFMKSGALYSKMQLDVAPNEYIVQ